MKPIIGITTGWKDDCYAPKGYIEAVEAAGGLPLMLPPISSHGDVLRQVSLCDGFVLIGGPDLDASSYSMENHPSMEILCRRSGDYYLCLAREIIFSTAKPMLGICLGHQVINVAMGGTLFRHIPEDVAGCVEHRRLNPAEETWHKVSLLPPLLPVFGVSELKCNSSHHQAVSRIGQGLMIAAKAEDGVVEAVCTTKYEKRFLVGLQWHPERIFQQEALHINIFKALISRA